MKFSGERFTATYRLAVRDDEARAVAEFICLEQTVELPDSLIPAGEIRAHVLGQIESFEQIGENTYEARISFATEIVGAELTQLVNVLFGNISLKPGVRLERFDLPPTLTAKFRGPRFGKKGVRKFLGVAERPLLCTALKPMGWSPKELADLAYQLALGGIDIIKDDHGLTNQQFAPFEERVAQCAEAVARANQETGGNSVYAPNITAPKTRVVERARFAKQNGAGALLICPGISGLDAMRAIADDDQIALPILSHPAFQGSFVSGPDDGISHYCLFGQVNRLAGADAAIFPNFGGRFAFSQWDCRAIAEGCSVDMSNIAPIFPTPAGGMSLARVPEMREMYGREAIFLIGAGLRSHSPDLIANCRYFREMAEQL